MRLLSLLLALVAQVTPPPAPPVLTTPQPSPSPQTTALPSPSPSSSPSPAAPPLATLPAAANLHPLQSQTLAIQNGTGPYTTSVDRPLVTATVDQNARTLTIAASPQTGSATVTLYDSTGASVQIPVRVALDAGSVPPNVTLRVTGSPVDPQWLAQIVQKNVSASVQTQPGASVTVQPFTLPAALGPGASAAVPVSVRIAGPDYFDVDATQSVEIQNLALAPFSPPLLMYDDDPEKLTQDGVLFRADVTAASPARLYYYHENTAGERELAVVLSASSPAAVQLIDASAGPNVDVMSVGHAVSRDFLVRKPIDEGIVVDVGPQAPYVADRFSMHRLDGAAGSVGIRVFSGGPVTVSVISVPAGGLEPGQLPQLLAQPLLPGDGHHRTGLFALQGYAADTVAYTAPGPDAQIQYGAQTPPAAEATDGDPVKTGRDYGDYGVLRSITFQIDNPLDEPQTLYLYERPMGGAVRSSFLVDGTLVQVGCARVSDRYQVGAPLVVPPQSALQLPVQTMTDGGSSYPLELGITATPPQPSVPPISAPDGCFPKPQPAIPAPAASPAPPAVPAPEPTGLRPPG